MAVGRAVRRVLRKVVPAPYRRRLRWTAIDLLTSDRLRRRIWWPLEVMSSPRLYNLDRWGDGLATTIDDAAHRLLGPAGLEHRDEFAAVDRDFKERYAATDRAFPDHWVVEANTAELLYRCVRAVEPETVLEVGVADGRSTHAILAALDRNGRGRLESVDVVDTVGGAVGSHPRWRLHIVPEERSWEHLAAIAGAMAPIDVYFHDARHDYVGQLRDYQAAVPFVRPGGLFISDDVEWTHAFVHQARALDAKPLFIAEQTKVSGALVVP